MERFTREELEQMRKLDAFTYLRLAEPTELVREGNGEYHTQTHDSLKIREDGVWHWMSRKNTEPGYAGKTALDYLINVCGLDFRTAAGRIQNVLGGHSFSFQSSQNFVPHKKPAFEIPHPDENNLTVLTYLQSRGLDPEILEACIRQGILYQTHSGKFRNCVFLCRDENGIPRAAITRGCGQSRYRHSAPGSNKQYGFFIQAAKPSCSVLEIYEAPIDLLSGATLHRRQTGGSWRSVHYLAMGGLDEKPIDHYLVSHPEIHRLVVRTDTDTPGRAFVRHLQNRFTGTDIEVMDDPPPQGHDYNDYLRLMLEKSRER